MIVSHKHKFIFTHCRKVAGSSMKVALSSALGEEDIVIGSLNEILAAGNPIPLACRSTLVRPKSMFYYSLARVSGKTHGEAINIAVKKDFFRKLSLNPPHPTAKESMKYFEDIWPHYFKFAFVRNPYEQVVSDYYWRMRSTGSNFRFIDFLQSLENSGRNDGYVHKGAASNWEMISINNEVVMDFVGRYENLEADFRFVCSKIGLSDVDLNVRVKPGRRNVDYGSLFGRNEREAVERLYKEEISYFGYEFPY